MTKLALAFQCCLCASLICTYRTCTCKNKQLVHTYRWCECWRRGRSSLSLGWCWGPPAPCPSSLSWTPCSSPSPPGHLGSPCPATQLFLGSYRTVLTFCGISPHGTGYQSYLTGSRNLSFRGSTISLFPIHESISINHRYIHEQCLCSCPRMYNCNIKWIVKRNILYRYRTFAQKI